MPQILIILLVLFWTTSVEAVETQGTSGIIYQTTLPANAQVPNWSAGWPQTGVTGWNYVGQIGSNTGPSAVYLGYGWVLTAAHVGMGNFLLNGSTYQAISGTGHTFTDGYGTADLTLFQIANPPNLLALRISQSPLLAISLSGSGSVIPGSSVVMIGYGSQEVVNGKNVTVESWGDATVDFINQQINPTGLTYVSIDFKTIFLTYYLVNKVSSNNNPSNLAGGDSGGGAFFYNASTQSWELAGINEVAGTDTITYADNTNPQGSSTQDVTVSGYVQLNYYVNQINAIYLPQTSDTPALPPFALIIMGGLLFFAAAQASLELPRLTGFLKR